MKRPRSGDRSCSSQASEDRAQVEASIEQVLNLSEISMRVLLEAEGVIRAGQCGLQVAQDRVDGLERRVPCAGGPAAGDMRLVQDAGASDGGEAAQPVGHQRGRSGERLFG